MNEATFLSALHESPNDEVTWLALADWLEEDGQNDRAELIRHIRRLRELPVVGRKPKERSRLEARVASLLAAGAKPAVVEIVNSIGMRFALIPPGRSRMGSPTNEKGRQLDETVHEVSITKPFYLGVFPVTQTQYKQLHKKNPSHFCSSGVGKNAVKGMSTEDYPVENVTWHEAVAYCEALSTLKDEKKAQRVYRLPTEAEWEYGCRGGSASTTTFHQGATLTVAQANIEANPEDDDRKGHEPLGRTCLVGMYPPNAFGLYDMHGNVWEWCSDWHRETYYSEREPRDPVGPKKGHSRVIRGGSWSARWMHSRAARRHYCGPRDRIYGFGFRVAMNVA